MTEAKIHVRAKISPGRIVHVVLEHGPSAGECRPGIVVREQDPTNQILRIDLFTDPDRDQLPEFRVHSYTFSPDGKPGTWHWPVECPVK